MGNEGTEDKTAWADVQAIQLFPLWMGRKVSNCINNRGPTRVNKYKLLNKNFHYDVRKYSFTARVVNIWNSLPDYVVDVDSVSNFKSRLDKFWLDQPVMFDWKADLNRTGSRSLKCDIRVD